MHKLWSNFKVDTHTERLVGSLIVSRLRGSFQAQVVDGLVAALQEQPGHFVQINSKQIKRS